jgi:hypothetical protein
MVVAADGFMEAALAVFGVTLALKFDFVLNRRAPQ